MEKNITALFEINVPRTAKSLTKFVGKDETRPVFKYVCIEPGHGLMVASDTHVLRTEKIECNGEWPEGLQILVDPKHIAKIAGKTAIATVSEVDYAKRVEIECEGETYTTEGKFPRFPDARRVIPQAEQIKPIKLNAENLAALQTICKLATNKKYVTLSAERGSNRLIVADVNEDYSCYASYSLELAENAEIDITIGLNPARLANCLTGSNGTIRVIDACRPAYFEGDSEHTISMPVQTMQRDCDYIEQIRTNRVMSDNLFTSDLSEAMKQMRDAAASLWEDIKTLNNKGNLIPGNYSAKDIETRNKAKCGFYIMPDREEEMINITFGNISFEFHYSELFRMFAIWESATKAKKMLFLVGNVEEVTETVMIESETGAEEKKMKLRKLGDNWYCNAKRGAKDYDVRVYYQLNGVIFSVDRVPYGHIDETEKWAVWVENHEGRLIDALTKTAENNPYYAEICRLTGINAPTPEEAKANIEAKRMEYERAREEAEKKRLAELRAREEAENLRKTELLADGKEKLMTNKAVTVEQIELLAEAVGYKINIRTIGFMREKVSEAVLNTDETVTVWGRNLTQRNISGTADVLREIAARIKAQTETEAQHPATEPKTPQISTEKAEIKEVSTEEQQPPTEPPQDTGTDGRQDIPPKPKESMESAPAAPPEPPPPKTILISSGPPGFKFIITPTINKNLILQNHVRHNNLAPPHLHNRVLRLPRFSDRVGYDLRHICARYPRIMGTCQADR